MGGELFIPINIVLKTEEMAVECEDDNNNYNIVIPYHVIKNIEIDDEGIAFTAEVETNG